MFKSVIVIFALFALAFAAPEPKADPKPKADPGVYAAAYTVPTSAVFERSYHGNFFPSAAYVSSPYIASPYVASPYVAAPYVASPYVASPYVSAAYSAPLYVR